MTDTAIPLSASFDPAAEADWIASVEKALKGRGGPEALTRSTLDGIEIRPLYREPDFAASTDPEGEAGAAPFIRGRTANRDRFLPWDIRQAVARPDPAGANADGLRDLERGVSSLELEIDPTGTSGIAITGLSDMERCLDGIRADFAPIALDHGSRVGTEAAAILGHWGEKREEAKAQRFAFNMDPLGALQRAGLVEGGLDGAFATCAALFGSLPLKYPHATLMRVDGRAVHEAGGSEAQELGALIAHGIDTLRRLDAAGIAPERAAPHLLFTVAIGGNYGIEIAKLRAARRLWARCLDALGIAAQPMTIQAITSARMLTRRDAWVNMLRGTAACFAGAVGGADIITVRPFNVALGLADELGRRVARNTQIIAMEESQLGRVADPAGGAWFTGRLADDLAQAGWAAFQTIEREGGYGASLMADAVQARIAETRTQRMKDVARRKIPVTGVSEFPLLDEAVPQVADAPFDGGAEEIDVRFLAALAPGATGDADDAMAEPLWPMRLAEPFERLRDHADAQHARSGKRPSIFLATLGPLAEHTARADFARNFFATGGIEVVAAPVPPESTSALTAAFKASGCQMAVLCGSDTRYTDEASGAASALKAAGAQRLYLAGKHKADGIDSHIFMGADVVATLELAHAELGVIG
ncbi:MAG: methylmalonyl-CoA mutase family protein [Pseudomonadota bacterium]